ncbi:MAG: ComF family protein [Lactobacillaceae bacterium]|nr:ComF family protein [Lactobacillaceae bacterium]
MDNNQDIFGFIFMLRQSAICQNCLPKFKKIDRNHCPQCYRQQKNKDICNDCLEWNKTDKPLKNQSIFKYDANFSSFMHRYKYMGDYRLRHEFNHLAKQELKHIKQRFDIVATIPLTSEGLVKRKFNQVEGIFGTQDQILKINKGIQMSGLSHAQRRKQVIDFEVMALVQDKKILLLDDVYTSGTTLHQASSALYQNGALQVQSLTLAR